MNCRHCSASLEHVFLDLGFAPPSNAYLSDTDLTKPEKYYPLKVMVCDQCWLVQTEDYAGAEELFSDEYAYFSSTSTSWLEHARRFSVDSLERFHLNEKSLVIEIASNDGYLLKNYLEFGVPCLGIEPTASTAAAAENVGVPVLREFFGEGLGKRLTAEGRTADLIIGNNVLAHVPDINDFARGLKCALKPGGTVSVEFPHLLRLIEFTQFDTVYHEHFSYLSLHAVVRIFAAAGLRVYDVAELPTHGGSLRVFACHSADCRSEEDEVATVLAQEIAGGLLSLETYRGFQERADTLKNEFLSFLLEQKRAGRSVAAYGAAAKGNTLLNYAGVKHDLLSFVCDAASAKQGKFLPGSHIAILCPEALLKQAPDFLVIVPWNLSHEIASMNDFVRQRGTKFVTAIPELKIW